MKTRDNRESGLTLIELLFVITLMAIVARFSIPNILAVRENYELNSATKVAASWLDDLRREAIQNSVSCNATWIESSGIIERRCGNQDYDPNLNLDINATTTKTINISINSGYDNPWIFTPRGTTTTAGQVRFKLQDKPENPGRSLKLTKPLALIRTGRCSNQDLCDYTNSF